MSIVNIVAREILDSRGNPTVEVDLHTGKGCKINPLKNISHMLYLSDNGLEVVPCLIYTLKKITRLYSHEFAFTFSTLLAASLTFHPCTCTSLSTHQSPFLPSRSVQGCCAQWCVHRHLRGSGAPGWRQDALQGQR